MTGERVLLQIGYVFLPLASVGAEKEELIAIAHAVVMMVQVFLGSLGL